MRRINDWLTRFCKNKSPNKVQNSVGSGTFLRVSRILWNTPFFSNEKEMVQKRKTLIWKCAQWQFWPNGLSLVSSFTWFSMICVMGKHQSVVYYRSRVVALGSEINKHSERPSRNFMIFISNNGTATAFLHQYELLKLVTGTYISFFEITASGAF